MALKHPWIFQYRCLQAAARKDRKCTIIYNPSGVGAE